MHSLKGGYSRTPSFPQSVTVVPSVLGPVPSNDHLLRIESPEHVSIPSRLTDLLLIALFPRGPSRTRPLCCACHSSMRRSRPPSNLASLSLNSFPPSALTVLSSVVPVPSDAHLLRTPTNLVLADLFPLEHF